MGLFSGSTPDPPYTAGSMNERNFGLVQYTHTCVDCQAGFTSPGPRAKRCGKCRPARRKVVENRRTVKRVAKKKAAMEKRYE